MNTSTVERPIRSLVAVQGDITATIKQIQTLRREQAMAGVSQVPVLALKVEGLTERLEMSYEEKRAAHSLCTATAAPPSRGTAA